MSAARFHKSPNETKRYTLDYSMWLDEGETITARTFAVTPTTDVPLEISASAIADDGLSVSFFTTGGGDGETYTITITITTSIGEVKEDTVQIGVKNV